ncbi:MAG: OmpA family protein [Bacteroidia bacterium]|nr:OmpA family protein [Bacteroidia bacterium]
MKKIITVLLILLSLSFDTYSQTSKQRWNLNISVGKNDYFGSYTQTNRVFNSFFAISSIQYSRFINPKLDLVLGTNNGVWAFSTNDDENFATRGFREFNVAFRYRFKRFGMTNFSPFVSIGVGTRLFTSKISSNENTFNDVTVPVSAGFDIKLGKKTAIRFESIFGFTNKNINDGSLSTKNTFLGKDAYFQNNLGFVFSFDFKSNKAKTKPKPKAKEVIPAKAKEVKLEKPKEVKPLKVKNEKIKIEDRDKDGISDAEDKCPDIKGVKEFNGCPENDIDGDGVTNENDNCPNIAGDPRFSGCLDSDNDGISDFHDKCPKLKGSLTNSGCPDTDGDGVNEDIDKCPNIAGLLINEGCPDSDNDGIPDHKDNCVLEPGTEELNGCPDRDNDGVGDKSDKCPDVYGEIEFNGCPKITVVPTKLKALIMAAKKGIQFEAGSAVLKPVSFPILNQIAVELKANANLEVIIQGHTDNKGIESKNIELSKSRAKEVANYLISKGIDKNRVSSEGFGGSRPVAENNTEANRSLNRRIDIIVK